jgi:hypothetical protein
VTSPGRLFLGGSVVVLGPFLGRIAEQLVVPTTQQVLEEGQFLLDRLPFSVTEALFEGRNLSLKRLYFINEEKPCLLQDLHVVSLENLGHMEIIPSIPGYYA